MFYFKIDSLIRIIFLFIICSIVSFEGKKCTTLQNLQIINEEKEADTLAMDLMFRSQDVDNLFLLNNLYGALLAVLSSAFVCKISENIKDPKHPLLPDRARLLIENAVSKGLPENDAEYFYHLCSQAFAMFLSQKNRVLDSYDAKDSSRNYFNRMEDILDEYITK